jgi:hypothetical protein
VTTAPRESTIVKNVIAYINSLPESRAEKTHGTAYGHPRVDVTGAIRGRRLEIEVKVPGEKPTARQLLCLRNWGKAGAITGVVTSVDDLRSLLDEVLA